MSNTVKVGYPANHRSPVLDMEFWIEHVEVNGELDYQILCSSYIKTVSFSRYVIHLVFSYLIQFKSVINYVLQLTTNDFTLEICSGQSVLLRAWSAKRNGIFSYR